MSVFDKNSSCKDIGPLLVFYACDEVSDKERKQIEAHIAKCEACAALLAEESHGCCFAARRRTRCFGYSPFAVPQRAGRGPGRSFRASNPGALASLWVAAPLDGVASCLEWRGFGSFRSRGGNSGCAMAAERP